MTPRHLTASLFTASLLALAAAGPAGAVGNVVISQVFGAGANAGAAWRSDYVELYNRSAVTVDLGGWSLQYASSTGTTWLKTDIPAGAQILPGAYALIKLATGSRGAELPQGCIIATGETAMSSSTGKVALVRDGVVLTGSCPAGGSIEDFVGYGAANCSETAPTAALNNSVAALRLNAGATDTDNNAADFVTGEPLPCAQPTPVSGTTWGRIKSLYR
jgi:hypothetical protein